MLSFQIMVGARIAFAPKTNLPKQADWFPFKEEKAKNIVSEDEALKRAALVRDAFKRKGGVEHGSI